MSDAFIAEIRMFGFTFPPKNWLDCNGQLLSIAQNTALFSLLGTTYGGNGQTNYAIPNLQDRIPVGVGQGLGLSQYVQGQTGGTTNITLLSNQMPQHNHSFGSSSGDADATNPASSVPARAVGETPFVAGAPNTPLSTAVALVGSSQPHNNMMPYLSVRFCICQFGVFPARN
jgi:microcystin-dependent protein